ncbi:MAG TPA: serine/threonine-protein kinase [Nannocystaceae bacterium]|nr:serine/threonine-protein kinase [Nannocystaceae bacterium]
MGAGGAGVVGDDLTGTTIGPYEVLARLATGGMAELLLAKRTGIEGFQKVVVLKRILPQYANQPDFVEMFLHEARLAATLEHPNVVPVFDIGKAGDDYYFAMAYLHGRDVLAILRELSRRGQRLPVVHAIAIAAGIAAGLHHAHERLGFDGEPLGIVHRDVSPANAIVTFDGAVKLVDFGIAKAAAQTNVTRVGVRKGKAAYMSPEQCRGDPLDRRADIWSLGIVLSEMLAMQRAFRADSELAIMHRIVSQDVPPPSRLQPDLLPDLEAIVMRCVHRDPAERWQSALELQRALETFASAHNLAPGAASLGEFLVGLFGTVPFPWSSATGTSVRAIARPVTPARIVDPSPGLTAPYPATPAGAQVHADSVLAVGAGGLATTVPTPAFDPSLGPSTGTGSHRESTDLGAPRRNAAGIAALFVAVAALAVVGWVAAARDPGAAASTPAIAAPAAPLATASASATAPPPARPTTARESPSTADLEAWLAAVHQSEPERALDWATRHSLLDRLAASAAASRIDRRVQLALDLRQIADAPRPCTALATTLAAIAADGDPWFTAALANATVPDSTTAPHAGTPPDGSCDGLEARLAELQARFAPPSEPAPAVASVASSAKPKRARAEPMRPSDPTPPPSVPAVKPKPPKAPDPPRPPEPRKTGKIDEDELRPFRKK